MIATIYYKKQLKENSILLQKSDFKGIFGF